jgi:RimJ/RimL family protein N-acetyltransferase
MAHSADRIAAVELETDRFRLVPIRPWSMANATWHWTRDTDALADIGWRTTGWTRRRWWRHLRKQTKGDRQCHGVWPKAGGPCIGLHLVSPQPTTRAAAIGVFIAERDWWGKGVVHEIRRAVIDDCFERMNMERVWAQVHGRNLASIYNYRKLGFTHEGTMRSAEVARDGVRMDVLMYGLLRDEWRAQRGESLADGR